MMTSISLRTRRQTIRTLPPALHDASARAIAPSLPPVFLMAAAVSIVAFLLTWLLREVPLRTTSRVTAGKELAGASSEETALET